jgi:recombination DNA repair RAD52 pathway protein
MESNLYPDNIDSNIDLALHQELAPIGAKIHSIDNDNSETYRSRRNDRDYLYCPLRPRTSDNVILDYKQDPITVARMLGTKPLRGDLLTRPGPGGKKLLYMSGESVSRSLNDIFGYDGWDLKIIKTEQTVCEKQQSTSIVKWCVAYIAHVRIIHSPSGTIKEDIGAGDSVDKHLPTAIQHAIKASITDATKRAARHFGDKLGNILYQGNFSVNSAPKTLGEALQQYDQQREMIWNCNRDASPLPNNSTVTKTNAPQGQGNVSGGGASINPNVVPSTKRYSGQVNSGAHVTTFTTEKENLTVFQQQEVNDNSRKRPLSSSCSSNLMEANGNNIFQGTSSTSTGIQDNQHPPKKANPYQCSNVGNLHSLTTSTNNGSNNGIKRFQKQANHQSNENTNGNICTSTSLMNNVVSNSPFTESGEAHLSFDPFESGWLAELNRPVSSSGTADNRLSALFNPITSKSAQVSTPVVGESGIQSGIRSLASSGLPAPVTVQHPSMVCNANLQSRVKNPYMSSK